MVKKLVILVIGVVFGIVLSKSEVISWFRIQEMFRFQAFHMYGVIGSAIVVGAISVLLIKATKAKTFGGKPVVFPKYYFSKGLIIGGFLFGMGWSMTGACPGPLFALAGGGYTVILVAIASALLGTYVYGWLKPKLPH